MINRSLRYVSFCSFTITIILLFRSLDLHCDYTVTLLYTMPFESIPESYNF